MDRKEVLPAEQEQKFGRVLKKEIVKKYQTAKSESNFFKSIGTPKLARNANFPYLWYKDTLAAYVTKFEKMINRLDGQTTVYSKLNDLINDLTFIESHLNIFDDQIMQEKRDLDASWKSDVLLCSMCLR